MKKFQMLIVLFFAISSLALAGEGAGSSSSSSTPAAPPTGVIITPTPDRETDVGIVKTMQVVDQGCTMMVQSAPGYKLDPYIRYEAANKQHANVWAQVKKDGLECVVREAAANLDQSYNVKSVRLIRPDSIPAYWVLGNPTNPCGGVVVGNRQTGGEVGRWTKGNTLGQGGSADNFNDMILLAARSNIALTSPRCLAYLRGFLGQPLQGPMGPAGQNGTNGVDGQTGVRGNFVFSGTVSPTSLYPSRAEDLLVGDQYIQTMSDRLVYYRWDGKVWVPFFTLTQARDGINGTNGTNGLSCFDDPRIGDYNQDGVKSVQDCNDWAIAQRPALSSNPTPAAPNDPMAAIYSCLSSDATTTGSLDLGNGNTLFFNTRAFNRPVLRMDGRELQGDAAVKFFSEDNPTWDPAQGVIGRIVPLGLKVKITFKGGILTIIKM